MKLDTEPLAHAIDRADERTKIVEPWHRRQERPELTAARLDDERGAQPDPRLVVRDARRSCRARGMDALRLVGRIAARIGKIRRIGPRDGWRAADHGAQRKSQARGAVARK